MDCVKRMSPKTPPKTEGFVGILRTKLNLFLDDYCVIKNSSPKWYYCSLVVGGGGLLLLLFSFCFSVVVVFFVVVVWLVGFCCCCCCLFVVYRKVSYTHCISFAAASSPRLAGVRCVIFLPGGVLWMPCPYVSIGLRRLYRLGKKKTHWGIGTECGLSIKGIDSGLIYVTSFNKGSSRIHSQAHNAA